MTEETTTDAPQDLATEAGEGEPLTDLEREGDIAADYLEELLDIADLDGDLDMDVEGDRASVSIVGGDVSQLVGRNGEVLEGIARDAIAEAKEKGEAVSLKPMSPFERKVVHDVVAQEGLTSESEGTEPRRYVVISPSA